MCLAVATHDPRTCGASLESSRPSCEALASGEQSRCAKALAEERTSCARDMDRLRTLLASEHDAHESAAPSAKLEIHGVGGTADPAKTEIDLSSTAAGGAVVAAEALGGAGIELARDPESSLRLAMRVERSHLAASVLFEAGGPKLTKLDLLVPALPELECPSPRCALTVTMPAVDPKRGAPITATIEGTVETPGGTYRLKLRIDTFVRDVVGRSAIYGGR